MTNFPMKYKNNSQNWYAFTLREDKGWLGIPVYERTFGTERGALEWLKDQSVNALITYNEVPENFWY